MEINFILKELIHDYQLKKHDNHGYISLEKLAEWNIHKSLDKDKDKDKEFECKKVY